MGLSGIMRELQCVWGAKLGRILRRRGSRFLKREGTDLNQISTNAKALEKRPIRVLRFDGCTPRIRRGVVLPFPSTAATTIKPQTSTGCLECQHLEAAYRAVIKDINAAVRGPSASVGEKLTRIFAKQDERDRILAQLYAHKHKAHSRKSA
jgi:hypothetical protein